MSSYTGLSPKGPNNYVGPNVYLSTVVTRTRRPTGADYRQPETGKLYPTGSYWLVGANPTTGVQGELWYLSKIVANVAYWLMLSAGGAGPILSVDVDSATAPGVIPVEPDVNGLLTISGAAVENHSVPIETHTRALNEFNIEVQYSDSAAAKDITLNGVAHFNSSQFSVDQGFVSLTGGGAAIDSLGVQSTSGTGTDPVVPDGTGKIEMEGALIAAGTNPLRAVSTAANTLQYQVQTSQALASADSTKVGLCNFDSADFSVDASGFVTLGGSGAGQTITGQSGGPLSPTGGNWNLYGLGEMTTSGAVSTLSILQPRANAFIVDPTQYYGTHQTIASALTDASSGDTILVRPGTYTEDLTLKAGVNICGLPGSQNLSTVNIVGKATATFSGTCSLSNLALTTNGDYCLEMTGSDDTVVILTNCRLYGDDHTCILHSNSNVNSVLRVEYSRVNLFTTGIAHFSDSSTGSLQFFYCNLGNDGNSTTSSTKSDGKLILRLSNMNGPLTFSSSNTESDIYNCTLNTQLINTTALTTSGTGLINLSNGQIFSGTASAISVGVNSTVQIFNVGVGSSNAFVLTGAGTLNYANVVFIQGTGHNVATETPFTIF